MKLKLKFWSEESKRAITNKCLTLPEVMIAKFSE
jgi:hypothetical protein